LENGVISSASDAGAGYFGPKTRASLKQKHTQWQDIQAKKQKIKEDFNALVTSSEKEAEIQLYLV